MRRNSSYSYSLFIEWMFVHVYIVRVASIRVLMLLLVECVCSLNVGRKLLHFPSNPVHIVFYYSLSSYLMWAQSIVFCIVFFVVFIVNLMVSIQLFIAVRFNKQHVFTIINMVGGLRGNDTLPTSRSNRVASRIQHFVTCFDIRYTS